MQNVFTRNVTPTYLQRGELYLGPEAVHAGGLVQGPIAVLVEGKPTLSITGELNSGHGLTGIRALHKTLGLKPGDVVSFVVRSPTSIIVVHAGSASPTGAQVSDAAQAAVRRQRRRYRPLGAEQKQFIASEICRLVHTARDTQHLSWRTARFIIDSLLWSWTADGIDNDGYVGRDKLKYDCNYQMHTREAKRIWLTKGRRGAGLRHEHAVPRREIIQCLLEKPRTEAETLELLERLCFAVVVTKDEEKKFTGALRNSMPRPWNCAAHGEALLARYNEVGLSDQVIKP